MVNELRQLLESIPDTYDDFVEGVICTCNIYPSIKPYIVQYIKTHEVTSSDVCEYETELVGIPSPGIDKKIHSLLKEIENVDDEYISRIFLVIRKIPKGKERLVNFLESTTSVSKKILEKTIKNWDILPISQQL